MKIESKWVRNQKGLSGPCNKINQYTENLSKEEFKEKEMIVDAVLRNIEILMKLQISFPRIFMKNMMKFPGALEEIK